VGSIFISHSSHNNDAAVHICEWLTANGWDDIFLDLDPERGIVAGQRWKEALQKAAHRCELVLALVSVEWVESGWCKAETDAARLMGKKIIVALIGIDQAQVPPDLRDEQCVDLVGDPDGYARLKAGLRSAGLDPSSFPFEAGRRPYPGFPPLEEQDAAIFFGRDAQIVRGLDKMRNIARTGVDRMLVILGASGSGKSSFLRAGLLPRLKRDDRTWLPLRVIRPERRVISGTFGLAPALQQTISEAPFANSMRKRGLPRSRAAVQEFIETTEDGLLKIFAALRETAQMPGPSEENTPPPTIVVPVDQGEELFNSEDRGEAMRFIEILAHTLKADPLALALVTMRSDAFPRLQNEVLLADLSKDTFTLDTMLEGSYRAIIEGPARLVQPHPLKIDPQLTDALLKDVSGQDALPLLAFTLASLYEQYAVDNELTLAGYEKLGRLKGVIDTKINEAFAEGVAKGELPKEAEAQLKLARDAFIPHLAQANASGQFVRRVATRGEVPAEALPVIDCFAEQRLLIKDRRSVAGADVEVIEVAHEALLRLPPLSGWLAEDQEFLLWRERLRQARAAFEAGERDFVGGRELQIARGWMEARPEGDIAGPDRAFINDSIAEEDKQAEREKEEQERRIRDAERIAAQKRTARATMIGLAVAVLVAGFAGWEYFVAARAEKLATSRQWAAQTLADLDLHAPRNLLLALNSISLTRQIGAFSLTESQQLLNDRLSSTGGLPLRHAGPVSAVLLSPDDRWLVGASAGEVRVWDMQALAATPRTLTGHDKFNKLAFSPDSRALATVGDDAELRLWDIAAADPAASVRVLTGHSAPIIDVAFAPNGHWLATASKDGTVLLRDLTASDPAMAGWVLHHDAPVQTLAFSPDGHWLATASFKRSDSMVRFWDLLGSDPTARPLPVPVKADVRKVAFSPDSQWLVAGDTETLKAVLMPVAAPDKPFLLKVSSTVEKVAFSPDGRWLATPGLYNASLWDLNKPDPSSEPLLLGGHKDYILDLGFSPDGTWFATSSRDHTVQLWNATDRFTVPAVLRGHEAPISGLAFSSDGRRLATASDDRTVRLWNTSSPAAEPMALRSRDGSTALHIWDLRASDLLAKPRILEEKLDQYAGTSFSPDGKWLATISSDVNANVVLLGNLSTPSPTRYVVRHDGEIWASPVFSPDGRWLVTAGVRNPTINLWDLSAADPTSSPKVLRGHRGPVRSLAISADGHRLVSGARDGLALVWDLTAENPAANVLRLAGGDVRAVAISGDGRYVITGSWEPDYAARIWDLSQPASLSRPITLSFTDRLFDVALSPDGRWAAAASCDQTTQLLDLTKPGVKPAVLQGHTARTLSVAFSPDGAWLATGSEDRTARLWNLAADDLSADSVVLHAPNMVANVSFSPDGRWLALNQTQYRSSPFSPDGSWFASAAPDTRLYHTRLEDLISLACRTAGRNLAANELPKGDVPLDLNVCHPGLGDK
jgi:WD40 repeat protein